VPAGRLKEENRRRGQLQTALDDPRDGPGAGVAQIVMSDVIQAAHALPGAH
jgi:hypothetical protein